MTSGMMVWMSVLASTLAIDNATVHTGDGQVIENCNVLIDGDRITAVGTDVVAPANAKHIDATGQILTPGFIETITQLGLGEVLMEDETVDANIHGRTVTPAFAAAEGFNPYSVRIPIEREEGVVTVLVSPRGGLIHGQAFLVDLIGDMSGSPDLDWPIAMYGSVSSDVKRAYGGARAGTWLRLREILDDVQSYHTNRRAFEKGELRSLSLKKADLEAMIPVWQGRMPLVLYANRVSDVMAALRLKKEKRVALVLAGCMECWKVASDIAEAKVPVIVTPSSQRPVSFEALAARDDLATLLHEAGVKVIISTNSWSQNVRRLRQEAGLAVQNGLPYQEALKALTLHPAQTFGFSRERGRLLKGQKANMILWSGDPFELRTIALTIIVNGKEMPMDNRQRELVRRYLVR